MGSAQVVFANTLFAHMMFAPLASDAGMLMSDAAEVNPC